MSERKWKLKLGIGVFLLLAFLVVFPDKVLEWLGEKLEWEITWIHYAIYEILVISLNFIIAELWHNFDPRINAWFPIIGITLCLFLRSLFSNFDDV